MDSVPSAQSSATSLDREIRNLRRRCNIALALALGCLFTCFAVMADALRRSTSRPIQATTITAEHLVVRRPESGASLVLGMNSTGSPTIGLRDKKGVSRTNIGIDGEGQPYLQFVDSSGVVRAGFFVRPQNGHVSSVFFNNTKGETRLALGLAKDDLPFVLLKDHAGQIRSMMNLTDEDTVGFQLYTST